MSLTELHIRNFQSIRRADVDLGQFTVFVGPSSSGKSALIRACRGLASNVRGSAAITRGQKQMAITARTDRAVVSLEREERGGLYRLTGDDGQTELFTKLGGDVPAQVTEALRIAPVGDGGSVNFAGQFDKPYLLDESGATVARVLGELTNVNRIFEAVRAANRVRSGAAGTLRTRKADLDKVQLGLAAFRGLSGQVKLLAEVERLDVDRRALQARVDQLDVAIRKLHIVERAVDRAVLPQVPSAQVVQAALDRYVDLKNVLQGVVAAHRKLVAAEAALSQASEQVPVLRGQLDAMLVEAQVCPTCGQQVKAVR